MEQLSCEPRRWRTLPVCHPAFTPGNQKSWGAGKHSLAMPVDRVHENFQKVYTSRFFFKCKRQCLTFIDKGYHESSVFWLKFYHLFRVAS